MASLFFFYSLLCFFFLSQSFSSSSLHHLCLPSKASALLQFKHPFEISDDYSDCHSSFPKTTSWNESRDCCTWDGVNCDMLTSHITGLDLSCSQLGGMIHPNNSLFQLQHAQRLNLAYNYFNSNWHSSIPIGIGRLKNLRHLNLSHFEFDGKIPTEISYLSNLVSLDLSSDMYNAYGSLDQKTFETLLQNCTNLEVVSLTGVNISSLIPMNLSSSLRYVDLTATNLQGVLTERFFLLPNLERLKLGHNYHLKGVLPKIYPSNTLLELEISYTGISGELPDSIGTLSSLNSLNLHGSISKLKQLTRLYLSSNSLGGEIPNVFSNLQVLVELSFSTNNFTGPFPSLILNLTGLEIIELSINSLSGPLPSNGQLPSSICKLKNLILLDLSHNNFNESVPHCLGSMTWLGVLDLRRNNFMGSLPPLCAYSTSLSTIVLNGNQFEGPVPVLSNCTGLEVLDLGNNAINDSFPAWLGTLPKLQVFILKLNKFHGPISSCQTKSCFPKLRIFDLYHNKFSGSLPVTVFESFRAMARLHDGDKGKIRYMSQDLEGGVGYEDSVGLVIKGQEFELERINTIMTLIDLSSNHFEGMIPKTLKDLGSLRLVNLSHNNLRGDIPFELRQLNMLEALDLSWNRLTGKILQELTRLTFLAKLNLSQNHLVGPIPHGPQFNTFDND
ncbi:receptor-like protein 9DC3 [Lycium barbarum]|uniref:receptor-like protein 9DC3 n=1 Tax=Lycium barbarum TaxID=112863 RepID=UPI00293F6F4E|nr:receptor-like protein 9DC3 [Lycium barbarum]